MLEAQNVTFAYRDNAVVQDVSLAIAPGEMVAVVGGNGSGKSTLARLFSGALLPDVGHVVCEGHASADPTNRAEVRRLVGLVVQNPADQLVSTTVSDEVGFGPQNLALSSSEVRIRVERALEAVGLGGYEARDVNSLSGGEQQRLALAGVLAMEPAYLMLDEVLSMVDSAERPELRALVRGLAHERGIGIVTITHDPLEALGADRVVVLQAGRVAWMGTPDCLVRDERELLEDVLLMGPYAQALCAAVNAGYELTHGVEPDALGAWLDGVEPEVHDAVGACIRVPSPADGASDEAAGSNVSYGAGGALGNDLSDDAGAHSNADSRADSGTTTASVLLSADGLAVGYDDHAVLSDVSLEFSAGTVTLMAGASGAGKTTLATVLAGLAEPQAGHVTYAGEGHPALAFQQPENQLFLESVEAELAFGPRQLGCDDAEVARRVAAATEVLDLDETLLERDPFSLSGGQARRVALGCVLALDASVLILDEPTSGLDAASRRRLHEVVREVASAGRAVLVISHDLEEWLGVADRVVLIGGGSVAWQGSVLNLAADADVFGRAGLAAPEAWELARRIGTQVDGTHGDRTQADRTQVDAEVRAASGGVLPRAAEDGVSTPAARKRPSEPSETAETAPSLIAGVDARVKLVLLFCAVLALFITQALPIFVVWVVIALVLGRLAGMGMKRLVGALKPVAVLLCFIVAANLVSCDGTASIAIAGPVGIDVSGGVRAVTTVARIALMVVLSLVVTATTTPVEVSDAFVRLARPLMRVHVPVDEIGLVLSLALRFIPLVMDEVERVRLAQRSRGVRFDEGGLVARIRVWGTVLIPVMVGLFRRADRLGAAMDARCYHEGAHRPHERRALSNRDRSALVMGLVIIVALALAGR